MSFGNMQYQQMAEQQHPLLSAISANNNAETQRAHYPWQHQQNPYLHYGRPLMGAASNHNGAYASAGSGYSGYGVEPSMEYEVPPSGSYSSYHPSGGSAPAHPPHPPHPQHPPAHPPQYHAPKPPPPPPTPPPPTTPASKKKRSSSSVMSALTLLSFFFFVNMLQSCIKEHASDINPTVMVLTSAGSRNRFNKLAEMNSREQTSTTASESAAAAAAAAAAASWQQASLVPAPSSAVAPVIVTPAVTLHTPYSSGLVTNKPASHVQSAPQYHHHHHHEDDYNNGHREPTSVADFYPNRTHVDQSLRPDSDFYSHHYYPERERQRHHYMDSVGPGWAYGNSYSPSPSPSPLQSQSHAAGNKRYSSSASLGAQSGVSSYTDNARYRNADDDDDDYDQRYGHHRRNDDDNDADQGPQRRISHSFYTRNN